MHQAGGVVGRQGWRADQSSGLQHNDGGGGGQQQGPAFAALAPFAPNHESGGQGGIDHHDFERQPVHASERRDVGQRNIVHLGDAQQVPGKSGDAGAGQLHRNPGCRGQNQRPAAEWVCALATPRQQADQQAEEAVIEGQVKAEKKEQSQRGQRAYPAVLAHGVVDPVAGAGIPENSADVGQKESLGRPGRQQFDSGLKLQGIWFPGPQKRDEQGSNRCPAQEVQIGQGKNQNLQAG